MNQSSVSGQPETIRIGQLEIRYLQEANGACEASCFEMCVPPGSNVPPPHSHSEHEELIYALEGTLRCTVGGKVYDLTAGQVVGTPRGVVHAFGNPHATMARVLVFNTPGIDSQYFREVGVVVNAGGPPDRAKLMAIMNKFGLVPALPAS